MNRGISIIMNKKKVALVFGITENYVFALANTLIGLKKHNEKFWDDIIIFYDNISENDKTNINLIENCIFKKFQLNGIYSKVDKSVLKKYSEACFYRYECFDLLKQYETVIWNDVDILIQNDISGLLEYGKNGLGITKNTANFKNEANFNKLLLDYNMYCPLYNSGILVLKDNLKDYDKMTKWCQEKTLKLSEYLRWPDQGIINLLIQEFNIEIDLIDIEKYCCHPSLDSKIKSAAIIHAYGDEKFWNSENLKNKFPEWQKNSKLWNNVNGSEKKINTPLVSCVMSTYNRYEFLKESVESILKQTYKNFELIIVLEKCENQNKIEQILKKINDKRIIIIKNSEKLGFAESLNIGISKSKGKYIARMDDDDISLPERFEKQVKFMEENPQYGIVGTKGQFFGKYNTIIPIDTNSERLKINTLFKTPFIHPTVMIRKDMIDKYNLQYDSNYFTEDYELWSRAIEYFPITNIDEVLLLYRSGVDNLTNGNNENKIHTSHKKIMSNQFNKYLHLEITNNELEVVQGRLNIFDNCYNFDETIELKNKLYEKIIIQNNKYHFYNEKTLKELLFFQEEINKNNYIKRIIKKLLKPVYLRLMIRVDARIAESETRIHNYYDSEINKIRSDINEKK